MKTFLDSQIDRLIESRSELLGGCLGLLAGGTTMIVLLFRAGLLAYLIGMCSTAVVGGLALLRVQFRPFGKGLLATASAMLTALPVVIFGSLLRSLG